MRQAKNYSSGFTLTEVLVALAIAGTVMAIIYAFFITNSRSYALHKMGVEIQQGLRVNMQLIESELRQTGFNPGGLSKDDAGDDSIDNNCNGTTDELDNSLTPSIDESEAIGIKRAQPSSIHFLMDRDGDGRACGDRESVTYSLSGSTFERNGTPRLENIDALNFVYLNGNGVVTTSLEATRSVQITIVGRTSSEDPAHRDTKSYTNLQGQEVLAPQNDGYHRRLLTSQVYFRNLRD